MNTYRQTTPIKSILFRWGLGAQSRYLQTSGCPPPLNKSKVILYNYLINRVSFATITVFFCPPARHRVAALRAVYVNFQLTHCKDI